MQHSQWRNAAGDIEHPTKMHLLRFAMGRFMTCYRGSVFTDIRHLKLVHQIGVKTFKVVSQALF